MKTLKIHPNLIDAFLAEALENVDKKGKFIQLIGILIGFRKSDTIYNTELVIPKQKGKLDFVLEEGKII